MCSICCPAPIKTIFDFVQNILQKPDLFFFLLSLFAFDPSSCLGLQALAECKPHLSQSPKGKNRDEMRSGEPGGQEVPPPPLSRSIA
jgi:hypothetical protein